jgi:hypothetical protein
MRLVLLILISVCARALPANIKHKVAIKARINCCHFMDFILVNDKNRPFNAEDYLSLLDLAFALVVS